MAPAKGKPKGAPQNSKGKGTSKVTKSSSSSKSKKSAPIKTTQQKTRPLSYKPEKKKKRVYTDKELGIPALNNIRPAGILKPRGTKKGKVFVDDKHGMLAILSMVQAEKEGDIESKMMRARQLEEIREAKRLEAEKREEQKRKKFEEVKDEVRKGKNDKKDRARRKPDGDTVESVEKKPGRTKKRVSFG